MNPKVKVVILNWNGEKLLKRCLDSVTNINYSNYQIIVIDNGSKDGSLDLMSKFYPKVELFKLDYNYGFSRGYNYYFKHQFY